LDVSSVLSCAFCASLSFSILEYAFQIMSDLTDREVAIFIAARRLNDGERMAYLDEACGEDALLRRKLDSLLAVDEAAGDFLERPAQAERSAMALPREPIE
jgi:hypothetical protein